MLPIKLQDGITILCPQSLSSITTYVLLEQERWFEKEMEFIRRFVQPGMNAIDIGANLGIYSLTLAKLVGPTGRVIAYEPGGEARSLIEKSVAFNGCSNIEISSCALSSGERAGYLGFAASSELRALNGNSEGEPVKVTSLDLEKTARHFRSVDFIKIDAEGEEEAIIKGGRDVFNSMSPLVMFEFRAGNSVNIRLPTEFRKLGYRVFRQLGHAPVLIPFDQGRRVDDFELNLFCAKPDVVDLLRHRNLAVESVPFWQPNDSDFEDAKALWNDQVFSRSLFPADAGQLSSDQDYRACLTAYATWLCDRKPLDVRCGALALAFTRLRYLCEQKWTPERASTFARVAADWGERRDSVASIAKLLQFLQENPLKLNEAFWPCNPRFDEIPLEGNHHDWLVAGAAEQYEKSCHFSSFFSGGSPLLPWLVQQPLASLEMLRRMTLVESRQETRPKISERLLKDGPGHLNPDLWSSGNVPGTIL